MVRRLALVALVAAGVALGLVALFVVRSGEDESPQPDAAAELARHRGTSHARTGGGALRRHRARTCGCRARRGPGSTPSPSASPPSSRPSRSSARRGAFAGMPGTPSICAGRFALRCLSGHVRPLGRVRPLRVSSRAGQVHRDGRGCGGRERRASSRPRCPPSASTRASRPWAPERTRDRRPGRSTCSRCRPRRTGSPPASSSRCSSSGAALAAIVGVFLGYLAWPPRVPQAGAGTRARAPAGAAPEPARAGAHPARAVDPGRRRGRPTARASSSSPRSSSLRTGATVISHEPPERSPGPRAFRRRRRRPDSQHGFARRSRVRKSSAELNGNGNVV